MNRRRIYGGGMGNDEAMVVMHPGEEGGEGIRVEGVQYLGRGGAGEIVPWEEEEDPEFLPPDVPLGGYIFICDVSTLTAICELMVFAFPEDFLDRVYAIRPGLPLFLYNLSTCRLHGVYEAAGYGGYNIEPRLCTCFHDPSRSSFPAQVRVRLRREYQPLDEQRSTRIMENLRIHRNTYYRYRVELSVPEAANIISDFAENAFVFE